jgi:hypothetical protein
MVTSWLFRYNSKSLTAQIRDAERKVLIRQKRVDVRAARMIRKLHHQMTEPVTLLLASGIGFILGELTQCQNPKSHSAVDEPRTTDITPLRTTLNFMTSAYTLYTALPLVWMMKFFKQPGISDQVDKRHVQPVTTASVEVESPRKLDCF